MKLGASSLANTSPVNPYPLSLSPIFMDRKIEDERICASAQSTPCYIVSVVHRAQMLSPSRPSEPAPEALAISKGIRGEKESQLQIRDT